MGKEDEGRLRREGRRTREGERNGKKKEVEEGRSERMKSHLSTTVIDLDSIFPLL